MIGERVKHSDVNRLDPPPCDRADVWLCRLDWSAENVAALQSKISADERARAARFLSERAKNRFILGRSVLRSLLAGYLSRRATEIEFAVEQFGKPRVADASLRFNLAHSGDWLLVGFTSDSEIGVDIERHRPVAHNREIAQRCFTPRELTELQAPGTGKQQEVFFRIWTRKEAVVKWHGSGLQILLQEIEVPLDDRCNAEVNLPSQQKSCWVRSLESPAGYSAALASSQSCASIVMREFVLS